MNGDLIENRADWLSRPVCSVILYTTVTQYILIAVKSIYPLFEVLLPSGFEKLFSVLLPLFEVGIYRRSQLRLSAASLSGIEASGACPLFQWFRRSPRTADWTFLHPETCAAVSPEIEEFVAGLLLLNLIYWKSECSSGLPLAPAGAILHQKVPVLLLHPPIVPLCEDSIFNTSCCVSS